MNDILRLLCMMNISIGTGGLILLILKRSFGKITHRTSAVLLLLCLIMPAVGQFSPVPQIQEVKISAQEYLGSTLSPPVLPEEGPLDFLPASSSEAELKAESVELPWSKILVYLYLLGSLAFALRFSYLYSRLQRDLRQCLEYKVYSRFKLLIHSSSTNPFSTFQWVTPVIVIPQNLLLSPERIWVIRHELQHIRQGDLYLTHLLELLVPLCYINPVFWWWKKSLSESMEFACDDRIIRKYPSQKKEYAYALINVAESSISHKSKMNLCAGMASLGREDQSILTRRIKMIVTKKKIKPWQAITSVGFVALASTLAFSAGVPPLKELSENLSADSRASVKKVLVEGIREARAKRGHVIITRPKTGQVIYAKGFSESGEELKDDYLSTPYAPHSLMKPIVTALALEAKSTSLDSLHECPNGALKIGDKEYKDYRNFKKLSTRDALIHSSNVCSIRIAQTLKNDELYRGMKNFGFGEGSLVANFPGAAEGLLRKYRGKESLYYPADLTIGYQALYPTPLEMTQAYGVLFNGGLLLKPSLDSKKSEMRRVISEETSRDMRKTLSEIVEAGTGQNAKDAQLKIGGKTSSSPGAPYDLNNRMSFIGAAPAEDAEYLVYVTLDGSEKGKSTGGKHAAPIVRKILKTLR